MRPSHPTPPRRSRAGLLLQAAATLGILLGAAALPAVALDRDVVVSVHQGPCREGDFPANVAAARAVVAEALARGSHFLAFPECFLSGYESREAVRAGARAHDHPDVQAFVRESAVHDMVILAGLARKSGTNLFNTVLVIHRGRLLGHHDKALLTPADRDVLGFSAGTGTPVFAAHGVRFGVLVCADTSLPHLALAARLQGAELVFTPHYNEIAESALDDHRRWVRNGHVGLAAQFQLAVARANVVKTSRPGQAGYGDSFILGPQGDPLAEARLFRTELVTATLTPAMFRPPRAWASLDDAPAWLRTRNAELLTAFRPPRDDDDLRRWLENMVVHHRFTPAEISAATGLTPDASDAAVRRFGLAPGPDEALPAGAPLRVLPFPGGRHPRLGFFDGAIAPQRETKVSVFTPWAGGGYVVVDVPEAIFSNLGLTYLAHTHIPTLWDLQGIPLPRLEWTRHPDGRLTLERTLPNGIAFGTEVIPAAGAVRFELWLRNGTDAPLTGLRVQNCVMLGGAAGFQAQSLANKRFEAPLAAAVSAGGRRWVITQWERCGRAWGNELVPCIHADPVFPDTAPGRTSRLRGWLSFYEGDRIDDELARVRAASGIP